MKLNTTLQGLLLAPLCYTYAVAADSNYFITNREEKGEGAPETQLRGSTSTTAAKAATERMLPTGQANVVDGPYETPLVAAAGAQLPNGIVLLWSAYARDNWKHGLGAGMTYTVKFNPTDGSYFEELIIDTDHDMFCPGTAYLHDGRILITGGNRARKVTIYDPAFDTWDVGPALVIPRGYHSMTPLSDGSVFTHGGSWRGGKYDKEAELFSEGSWTVKPSITGPPFYTLDNRGVYRADNHYWLFQAPNGRIFHAGPAKQMHWIDVAGDGSVTQSLLRGDDEDSMCGNAVMYDVGKILTVGGSRNYDEGTSSNRAYIVDINGDEAQVERVGNMTFGRTFHNSIVLPSGEVLVVGGQSVANPFFDTDVVYTVEIWDPDTKLFSELDTPLTVPRVYHSVGLLLKDARVLCGGGGLCGNCTSNHPDVEIITPPYLLNSDGSFATRPEILSYPAQFDLGQTINVRMDSAEIHTFALIRLGVATHATNNDQRRIPLNVDRSSTSREFTLSAPENPAVVMPGPYYLFAMNQHGVPSMGVDLMITNGAANQNEGAGTIGGP